MKENKQAYRYGQMEQLAPSALQTLVETVGDRRILVENHHGVTEYSKQMIRVKASFGVLCISGRGLRILQMTKSRLVVAGYIQNLQLVSGVK